MIGTLLITLRLDDGSTVSLCSRMDVPDLKSYEPAAIAEAEEMICQKVATGYNMFASKTRRPLVKHMTVNNGVWD